MRCIHRAKFPIFALIAGIVLLSQGGPAAADHCILDDLIVDGSACIGLDCVCNTEIFGFDTLRLKENNLRITFIDTSVAASYPRGDWQIRANDSANGGANKFVVDWLGTSATSGGSVQSTPFTIEGDAPNNAVFVRDNGNVGFGTSVPALELHVRDGDTPSLRLEQDGSSGFTPQTWDVAGNETNFFLRDVTNGSALPFRIRPEAPSNSIFVENNGDVGLGTSSPNAPLHVLLGGSSFGFNAATAMGIQDTTNASSGVLMSLVGGNTGNAQITFGDTDDQTSGRIRFNNSNNSFDFDTAGATRVTISAAGLVTTTGGGACNPGPCDGVFAPEYEVESIDEHSEYMWANRHLWGVGPTPEDGPINLTTKVTGILHELEKAHIYIEQLHERLATGESEIERTRNVDARLWEAVRTLSARNAELEGQLTEMRGLLKGTPRTD